MPLTKETVAVWLAAYVRAWDTYDPDTIGDLFTEDATYAYHPFEEPVRGRLAIVASWLENKDARGTYEAGTSRSRSRATSRSPMGGAATSRTPPKPSSSANTTTSF